MCISSVTINDKRAGSSGGKMMVPCGRCHECRAARSASWSFRILEEYKNHTEGHFVTFTIDNEHLAYGDDIYPTLVKSDVQKYFKRLRFNSGKKIKYYACGEYGSRSKRPHYHAIIFGVDVDSIRDNWKAGHVQFGTVSHASIRYVTNYLCKRRGSQPSGTAPEFSLMSLGIGKSYLTPEMIRWHKSNMANYVVLKDGIKQLLPRYFRDKIFTEGEKFIISEESLRLSAQKQLSIIDKHGYVEAKRLDYYSKMASVRNADCKQFERNKL